MSAVRRWMSVRAIAINFEIDRCISKMTLVLLSCLCKSFNVLHCFLDRRGGQWKTLQGTTFI